MAIVDTRPAAIQERELCLLRLLQRVSTFAFTTKSDNAREWADEIAEAASRGLVTTQVIPGRDLFGRLWKVTREGLTWLERNSHRIADIEVDDYVRTYAGGSDPEE